MASKITIPDLKKIRVTDPLFSHYAGMVAKKMIPVQWEILNGKQGQSRCFCIDNFRIAGLCDAYRQIQDQDTSGPVMNNSQTVYAGLTYGRNQLTENMADQGTNRGMLV